MALPTTGYFAVILSAFAVDSPTTSVISLDGHSVSRIAGASLRFRATQLLPPGTYRMTITNCKASTVVGPSQGYRIGSTNGTHTFDGYNAAVVGPYFMGQTSNVRITPAALQSGQEGTELTVKFTTASRLPVGGSFVLSFPSGFSFNQPSTTVADFADLTGSFSTSADANKLTITRTGGSATSSRTMSVTVNNVRTSTAKGVVSGFTVSVWDGTGMLDDVDDPASVILAGQVTDVSFSPSQLAVDAVVDAVIRFTLATPLPATGVIGVALPTGFSIDSASVATSSTMDGDFDLDSQGRVLIIERGGGTSAAAGLHAISLTDVHTPASGGPTNGLAVSTQDDDDPVDFLSEPAAGPTLYYMVTDVSCRPVEIVANTPTALTITFTTGSKLATTDAIVITLPPSFSVAPGSSANSTTLDGTFNVDASGGEISIARTGDGTESAAGVHVLTVSGALATAFGPSTGVVVTTRTSVGALVDIGNVVLGDGPVVTGQVRDVQLSPAFVMADVEVVELVLSFTTASELPPSGFVDVEFPDEFGFTKDCVATSEEGETFDIALGLSSTSAATLTRTGTSPIAPGVHTITFSAMTTPRTLGATFGVLVSTRTSSHTLDATSLPGYGPRIAGMMTAVSASPKGFLAATDAHELTVTFTSESQLPKAGSRLVVTLPPLFEFNHPSPTQATIKSALEKEALDLVVLETMDATITLECPGRTAEGYLFLPQIYEITLSNVLAPAERNNHTRGLSVASSSLTGEPLDEANLPARGPNIGGRVFDVAMFPPALRGNSSSIVEVVFTTVSDTPKDALIIVHMPAGFSLHSGSRSAVRFVKRVESGVMGGMNGTLQIWESGTPNVVWLKRRDATKASPPGSYAVELSSVFIGGVGLTEGISVSTQAADEYPVDLQSLSVTGPHITGRITDLDVLPTDLEEFSEGHTLTLLFTTPSGVPKDGKLHLILPRNFTFGSPLTIRPSLAEGLKTMMTGTLHSNEESETMPDGRHSIMVGRVGGRSDPPGRYAFTIFPVNAMGAKNQYFGVSLGTVAADGSAVDLQSVSVRAPTLRGAISLHRVGPAEVAASSEGNVLTLNFATVTALAGDAEIVLNFPSNFLLNHPAKSIAACKALSGGANSSVVNPHSLTLKRVGGSPMLPGSLTVTVTNVKAPSKIGDTWGFTVSTHTHEGQALDMPSAKTRGPHVSPKPLSSGIVILIIGLAVIGAIIVLGLAAKWQHRKREKAESYSLTAPLKDATVAPYRKLMAGKGKGIQ